MLLVGVSSDFMLTQLGLLLLPLLKTDQRNTDGEFETSHPCYQKRLAAVAVI